MVEAIENVSSNSADAVEKIINQNAAQSAEEDFNKLDVSEIQDSSKINKMDISAIESIEINEFETALGVAFKELDSLKVGEPNMNDPAYLNHLLEQLMNSENQTRDRYVEWGTMLEEMSANGLESSMNLDAIDASNPQEMLKHMQSSLNQSLEYQQQFELQAMELGIKIEASSWIRSIASALVKGTRRLITQT